MCSPVMMEKSSLPLAVPATAGARGLFLTDEDAPPTFRPLQKLRVEAFDGVEQSGGRLVRQLASVWPSGDISKVLWKVMQKSNKDADYIAERHSSAPEYRHEAQPKLWPGRHFCLHVALPA